MAKNRRTANNPCTVNAGNRHDADVLAVRGVRRRTEEAGDHRRQAVSKHRTMQAGSRIKSFFTIFAVTTGGRRVQR